MFPSVSEIRKGRLEEIYRWIEKEGGAGKTVREVGEYLEIKSDTYVRNMLFQMCGYKWLVSQDSIVETGRGRRLALRFYVAPPENVGG